jgi:hypothetical protein
MKKLVKRNVAAFVTVLAVCALAAVSAAVYALWVLYGQSGSNTVRIADAAVITLNGGAEGGSVYFDDAELAAPGAAQTRKIVVKTTSAAPVNFSMSVATLGISGDAFNYSKDDLYLKTAEEDSAGAWSAAIPRKFEQGAVLVGGATVSLSTDYEIYLRIGLGDNATMQLCGRSITFTIATSTPVPFDPALDLFLEQNYIADIIGFSDTELTVVDGIVWDSDPAYSALLLTRGAGLTSVQIDVAAIEAAVAAEYGTITITFANIDASNVSAQFNVDGTAKAGSNFGTWGNYLHTKTFNIVSGYTSFAFEANFDMYLHSVTFGGDRPAVVQ